MFGERVGVQGNDLSIVGAEGGVNGVEWRLGALPLLASSATGTAGFPATIVQAVRGARALNLSWATTGHKRPFPVLCSLNRFLHKTVGNAAPSTPLMHHSRTSGRNAGDETPCEKTVPALRLGMHSVLILSYP